MATETRQKGRAVPPLATFTFPVSGVTVQIRPMSQFTIAHIEMAARRKFPSPQPPLFTADYGDGPKQEPNPAHPDYQAELKNHKALISGKIMDGMIELGVEVEIDQVRLDEVKRVMELIGTPLDEVSEKVAYVKHCCVVDIAKELPALGAALRGVTEEAVTEHAAAFPGDVQGA